MGTPQQAVPVLEELASRHDVIAVVTAVDTAKGRGLELSPSPVKRLATGLGIRVLQPATLRDPAVVEELRDMQAEVICVAAYGMILPEPVLELTPLGCINVHFSLLPEYRGAAPVQRAILDGASVTGVSIMKMDSGLDTGPVLARREVAIEEDDDAGTLSARLAVVGAELLTTSLDAIQTGLEARPQDGAQATYARKIEVRNLVRAMNPKPGAWTHLAGMRLKVWKADLSPATVDAQPGLIIPGEDFTVVTGSGSLVLTCVQLEGKRKMQGSEFVRGHRIRDAERLE